MKNNYQIGKIEMDKIIRKGIRPSLLLHSCCGPCSTYPLELLTPVFDITIFFNNSNIYPKEEYFRRLDELKKYVDIFNKENKTSIKIIETPFHGEEYMDFLSVRKDDPERGQRCLMCYERRMKEAYSYANENHFDYFTTVMTISRQKSEQAINAIGLKLQEQFANTKYLVHNFKKKGGQERKDELVKIYKLYQQTYCGCVYSFMNKKEEEKDNEKV